MERIFNHRTRTINVTVRASRIYSALSAAFAGASQISLSVISKAIIGQYNNGGFDSRTSLDALIHALAKLEADVRSQYDLNTSSLEDVKAVLNGLVYDVVKDETEWFLTCHLGYKII